MPAGKVHEGMMEAATFVHFNSAATLEKAGQQFKGWPLFVTGHSLGGQPIHMKATQPCCLYMRKVYGSCSPGSNMGM